MFLKPANQCPHESCRGEQLPPKGYFGGWKCQCPCHKLTGKERVKYIDAHPEPMQRLTEFLQEAEMKKKPTLPPNCRPATLVTIQLTVGQEKVIRKSFAFDLMGDVAKTVEHFVQCAVIDEAIKQTGKRKA